MGEHVMELDAPEAEAETQAPAPGVVIGVLMGFGDDGRPLVIYPGNPKDEAIVAYSTAQLAERDVGREVALLFEGGDPARPVIIGRILPSAGTARGRLHELEVRLVDERLELSARREVVIRCGKASITLTPAGKVLIRGTYISSRSSGVNKVKGGSVQLN